MNFSDMPYLMLQSSVGLACSYVVFYVEHYDIP